MMNKNQKITIAAILIISFLLGVLIIFNDKHSSGSDDHGHAEHAVHKEHKEHKEHANEEERSEHDDEHAHGADTAAKKAAHGHEHEKGEAAHQDTHDDRHLEGDHQEKIAMSEEQIKASGISLHTVAPALIKLGVQLPGEIRFNEDRTAHITPRLSGVVEAVPANLGQQVKKGQVLAVISSSAVAEQRSELLTAQQRLALARTTYAREKKLWEEKISAQQDYLQAQSALREAEIAVQNAQQKMHAMGVTASLKDAMNRYEIRAPFNGTVVEKRISLGESVKEDASIFTLSDLSTVWAEVAVPAAELNKVRVGESAIVKAAAFESAATGRVSYIGSLLGEQTRAAKARIVLANPKGAWRPGLVINAEILSDKVKVPVAVVSDAIQTVDGKPTVFVRAGDGFMPQAVTVGRSDGKQVEINEGLEAGQTYAGAGSFVIKSELEKASAGHEH
jgi:cobalt-zinc-cadmium efflux system membrane fusion protein